MLSAAAGAATAATATILAPANQAIRSMICPARERRTPLVDMKASDRTYQLLATRSRRNARMRAAHLREGEITAGVGHKADVAHAAPGFAALPPILLAIERPSHCRIDLPVGGGRASPRLVATATRSSAFRSS